MELPSKGAIHAVAVQIFRSVAEWLIARRLASERLRWRVRRFEQQGFGSLLEINYPYAFITLNVVLMVLMWLFGTSRVSGLGSIGAVSGIDSYRFGAAFAPSILAGQYWRLLTAVFLHGDLMHLLFNCIAIYIIAPRIEAVYGPQRFLALCLLAGIAGNATSIFTRAFVIGDIRPLVGASGAIFGLLGAGAIYGLRVGGTRGDEVFKFMMTWIVIGVVYSFWRGADNLAHAGGAIAGGLVAQMARPHAPSSYHRELWRGIELGCLILIMICFALMLHSLFTERI
ncbi:MAG: rhomboid family intramembrane serine protease [bacterium]